MMDNINEQPGLFGQKYSSRDYTKPYYWGKNQFNSSFPASLVAYLSYKKIDSVYLCTDKRNNVVHKYIGAEELLGIDPLSDGRNEIRNIILGGGQNLLSPERRFDAVIVNSPDLFD